MKYQLKRILINKATEIVNSFTELNLTKIDPTEIETKIINSKSTINTITTTVNQLNSKKLEITNLVSNYQSAKNSIVSESDILSKYPIFSTKSLDKTSCMDYKANITNTINDKKLILVNYDKTILDLSTSLNKHTTDIKTLRSTPDKCPTCKQDWIIKVNPDDITKLESEIVAATTLLDTIKSTRSTVQSEIDTLTSEVHQIDMALDAIERMKPHTGYVESLRVKIPLEYETVLSDIDKEISVNNNTIQQFNLILESLQSEYINAQLNNSKLEELDKSKSTILELSNEIVLLESSIASINTSITELSYYYTKVLTNKGLLVAKSLEKVSDYLNTDERLRVTTTDVLKNGNVVPSLNIDLYVPEYDKYIRYSRLSGGQKVLADIIFLAGLTELTNGVGVMMLDEIFKFFDEDNILQCVDILHSMNCKCTYLIVHSNLGEAISSNRLSVSLTESGSQYEIVQ